MTDPQVHLRDKLKEPKLQSNHKTSDNKDKTKKTKLSSKAIPEKQISLYSAVITDTFSSKNKLCSYESPVNKLGKGNKLKSEKIDKTEKVDKAEGENLIMNTIDATIKNTLSKGKYEAFVPKAKISEAQLKSPTSTTYKSYGSTQSKHSFESQSINQINTTGTVINSKGSIADTSNNANKGKTNDFKLKYKTEKCKFWELYKECKYGDNVSE